MKGPFSAMSEPDKHHYLPVFYLSQWAGSDGKVMRYHRPVAKVVAHPIAPRSTGFERGLYRLDGYAPDQRNAIEKSFMAPVVDDPAAQALRVLIERDHAKMTPEMRRAWTRFIMSLHVRHPARVDQISREASAGLKQSLLANPEEYDAVRSAGDAPTLLEWVEQNAPVVLDNFGKQLLPGIITHAATGDALIKMRWWTVGIDDATPDLLTSDRPLYMSHGVADPACFVALPIAPRFIFCATRDEAAFQRVMARGIVPVVKSLNELLVRQAEQYVYAAHRRHMRFVENRLRTRAS